MLLQTAAAPFLRRRPPGLDATPDCVLLLRQRGLRDDLLSLAAQQGSTGWFDPPIAVFAQIPDVLGSTDRQPAGDYERMVPVERALRETIEATHEHTVLGRIERAEAWLDALDRFFGELAAEGVTPDAFEAAVGRRPGTDDFERRHGPRDHGRVERPRRAARRAHVRASNEQRGPGHALSQQRPLRSRRNPYVTAQHR